MPAGQNQISQKDFADALRAKVPELKNFSDYEITNKILEMRPELKNRIYTPDMAAADEQARLEKRSHSIVDPETWKNHPLLGQIAKSVSNALPGAGMILGGAAATPETLGMGTLAGGALGAGVGQGLRGVSNQMLGLEDTSPMQKAKNIAFETGLAAITPGAMTAIKHPIDTSRMAASALNSVEGTLVPRGIRPFIQMPFLKRIAEQPLGSKIMSSNIIPMARYPGESIRPGSQEMENMVNEIFNKRY